MNTNYNIYTRNPVPNAPEFSQTSKTKRTRSTLEDESNLAKSVRKRLYGSSSDQTQRTSHLTLAQKQKLGREKVLDALLDQPVKDQTILDILVDWSINDLGISETVTNQIFSTAVVTTESIPKKSVFKIRVKI
ncbi:hypothetical protein M9Y10_024034 [Tritrichomonas musculus]|uniref:Uncharacterized protein n=1 Tax=Tritrichomonas musculus TaxID=1915356 RepID=A0ABR2KWR1_9EUKA